MPVPPPGTDPEPKHPSEPSRALRPFTAPECTGTNDIPRQATWKSRCEGRGAIGRTGFSGQRQHEAKERLWTVESDRAPAQTSGELHCPALLLWPPGYGKPGARARVVEVTAFGPLGWPPGWPRERPIDADVAVSHSTAPTPPPRSVHRILLLSVGCAGEKALGRSGRTDELRPSVVRRPSSSKQTIIAYWNRYIVLFGVIRRRAYDAAAYHDSGWFGGRGTV